MPFKSTAQQRYLFARHPSIARRFADETPKGAYKKLPKHVGDKKKRKTATVSSEELQGRTPTKSHGPLAPTDAPTQTIKTIGPEGSNEKVPVKQAQAICVLYLAHLTKQACEDRRLDHVRKLTKAAETFAVTRSLPKALEAAWPEESPEQRAKLALAMVHRMRDKEAWVLQDAAKWLEEAPGKAWQGIKGMAGKAYDWAADKVSPVTRTVGNAGTSIGNFGRGVLGAMSKGWQGMRQGWNEHMGGPPAPPAPAAPPVTAVPPPQRGAFSRPIGPLKTANSTAIMGALGGLAGGGLGAYKAPAGSRGPGAARGAVDGVGTGVGAATGFNIGRDAALGQIVRRGRLGLSGLALPALGLILGGMAGHRGTSNMRQFLESKVRHARGKTAQTDTIPMPQAPPAPVAPRNKPFNLTNAAKRKVRYSFHRAPAKS